ncbi:MerR family transcriptional regulator [Streptomyces sp. NPDC001914]|uniref:MerR family transcriptional regulator n=1 Tax=Streptomyces sp. NPDC001914 TaxID=3364623 RepID=UPI0036B1B768
MELSAHERGRATDPGVSTGFLARKVGVSPTTLRSWDRRYGLGPAVRTDGRHRRWSPEDVAMVEEMCRLTAEGMPPAEAAGAAKKVAALRRAVAASTATTSQPAGLESAERSSVTSPPPPKRGASRSGTGMPLGSNVRQECRGLARAAVRLNALAVQKQLTAAVLTHGLTTAWEEVMVPTLQAAGRKWESSGDRYIEIEHLLSWHISATLRGVYASSMGYRRDDISHVLLAGVPGETHTLPLEALSAVLAEKAVPVLMLGGAVPPEALMAAVSRVGPSAVVLWSQSRSTVNLPLASHVAARRSTARGSHRQNHVLLSGPGWDGCSEPGLLRPQHLTEALQMIATLEN